METLALLQASMVAVSSERISGSSVGKPAEKKINILRPGMARRFLARVRRESSALRAAKSDSDFWNAEAALLEAISVPSLESALEETLEEWSPLTAALRATVSEVKFWRMIRVPPKSTTASRVEVPAD